MDSFDWLFDSDPSYNRNQYVNQSRLQWIRTIRQQQQQKRIERNEMKWNKIRNFVNYWENTNTNNNKIKKESNHVFFYIIDGERERDLGVFCCCCSHHLKRMDFNKRLSDGFSFFFRTTRQVFFFFFVLDVVIYFLLYSRHHHFHSCVSSFFNRCYYMFQNILQIE